MKVISRLTDRRINAQSILVEMSVREYMGLVDGAESNLDIQRQVIKGFKPYDRLREDLKKGCIIPPLVLGLKIDDKLSEANTDAVFAEQIIQLIRNIDSENVFIIDGLQRTNAIKQVRDNLFEAEKEAFEKLILRVEIWPDITLAALTYRMILLNAGQKPMSLKHQLEVVSRPLCISLDSKYGEKIKIIRQKDAARRSRYGHYNFSVIAQSFQAFVQKSPNIDVRNEVIAELNQIDVLANYGDSLAQSPTRKDLTTQYIEYIGYLLEFDEALCMKYSEKKQAEDGSEVPSGVSILARDSFHLGIAAAYGWCLEYKPDALEKAKTKLITLLGSSQEDPLEIVRHDKIQAGFSRKDNIGEQTRKLVFDGFKEYFRSEGLTDFSTCWIQA